MKSKQGKPNIMLYILDNFLLKTVIFKMLIYPKTNQFSLLFKFYFIYFILMILL